MKIANIASTKAFEVQNQPGLCPNIGCYIDLVLNIFFVCLILLIFTFTVDNFIIKLIYNLSPLNFLCFVEQDFIPCCNDDYLIIFCSNSDRNYSACKIILDQGWLR